MPRPTDRPSRLTEQVRATLARQRRVAKLQLRETPSRSVTRSTAPPAASTRTG